MATPVTVQMNLHPIMNWDSDDIVEASKKFKTQLAFESFLKGKTEDENFSHLPPSLFLSISITIKSHEIG
ncbi:Hypothetical predicted protein [Octopus vulgaris]|uniref:Uncharacterized protein n=1 Tax=Octopus vulgaris TaxID=6645 RepID=A0AA36FLD3_OCTVU|nr:Hypothetical predicted protein [Octopus vulgaris]